MSLANAIKHVEALAEQTETNRKRAILFVAFDRELTDVNNLRYAMYDPYEQPDEWVVSRYDDDVAAAVFEEGDYLKGEDYETLDILEGRAEAYQRVLTVLRELEQES